MTNNRKYGRSSIPDFFTPEWYDEQKNKKKTDKQIAKELFISITTLYNWKNKVGCKFKDRNGAGRGAGRPAMFDIEEIIQLVEEEGLSYNKASNVLGCSNTAVRMRYKRHLEHTPRD